MTKNLGHLLLAIYLIYIGAIHFVPSLANGLIAAILAIAAGVLLLMRK
jgi:hypothetical protein